MSIVKAEIISIGNEILSGQTVNTNASWIAQKVTSTGLTIEWITCIADKTDEIKSALKVADKRADVVFCTGGLGPTPDDITKSAICEFFNTKMILHENTLENIQNIFEGRFLKMPEINRDQAMIPASAEIIENPIGTAPGLIFTKDNQIFFFLPGVPKEMFAMMENKVLKRIQENYELPKIQNHLIRTTGIPESRLYEKLEFVINHYAQINSAFLPKFTGVDIMLQYIAIPKAREKPLASCVKEIKEIAGEYIYSETEKELEEVIGKLLVKNKLTLAIAESFTGGLISDRITNVPGSSEYFRGSTITYCNMSKKQLLNVPENTLKKYGAVSEETAEAMVKGIKDLYKSNCAIASTGIAGPTGGTSEKPVGLCFIAAAHNDKIVVKKFNFGKDRRINKERGASAGLEILRRLILNS